MPRLSPQHALARRALIEDIQQDKRAWTQHGVAALAVSVLGLGVAGSVLATGSAAPHIITAAPVVSVQSSVQPGVTKPTAFDRDTATSRGLLRSSMNPTKVTSRADQRAEALSKAAETVQQVSQARAVKAREEQLAKVSAATQQQGKLIKARGTQAASPATGTTTLAPQPCRPSRRRRPRPSPARLACP